MTKLEGLLKSLFSINNIQYKTSFGQNGGQVVTAGTYTGNFCYFVPDSDGAFGTCVSNITGLSGTNFYKGIPKAFSATQIIIASGSGTLYNA